MLELVLIIAAFVLMYIEGLAITTVASLLLKQNKYLIVLIALLWPLALPVLFYIAYKKVYPLVEQVRSNPLLRSLVGMPTQSQNEDVDISSLFSLPLVDEQERS